MVEDKGLATLIKSVLEKYAYISTTAYDGLMGLKLVSQYNYDLIMTDIVLPKNG